MSRSFIFNIQILLLLLTSCQHGQYLSLLVTIIYPPQFPSDKIAPALYFSLVFFFILSSTELADFPEY